MAKQEKGIIDVYRGRVGTVVGYQWRGRWCLRARPVQVRNPRTPVQQAVRGEFRALAQLAVRMLPALHRGLRHEARLAGLTECNLFISLNRAASTEAGVDYNALTVSAGPVAPVAFGRAVVVDGAVGVDFEKNPQHRATSATDEVRLFAYCPTLGHGLLSGGAPRRDRRVAMALPDEWAGLEVHLYGFVEDAAGRASESAYIGALDWDAAAAPGAVDGPDADNTTAAAPAGAAAAMGLAMALQISSSSRAAAGRGSASGLSPCDG